MDTRPLTDFLLEAAGDPQLHMDLATNPEQTVAQHKLPQAAADALLSGSAADRCGLRPWRKPGIRLGIAGDHRGWRADQPFDLLLLAAAIAAQLTVVGTGIMIGAHLTSETRQILKDADVVLHVASDPLAHKWLVGLNPNAQSLHHLYETGKQRTETYSEIVEVIEHHLNLDRRVCLALYGNPAVYAYPGRAALARAAELGVPGRMLPGVSAEDCLLVDLQLDPGERGWQSYEATDFLARTRSWDVNTPLLLWQISSIGRTAASRDVARDGLVALAERLASIYGETHDVTVYLAPTVPGTRPTVQSITVSELAIAPIPPLSTLYVPPLDEPPLDWGMMARLGFVTPDRSG